MSRFSVALISQLRSRPQFDISLVAMQHQGAHQRVLCDLEKANVVLPDMACVKSIARDRLYSQEIRGWVAGQVRELQQHLSCLLSLHNSTLPLHDLPTEIFENICRLASAGLAGRQWLVEAVGVCRHWRDIILGSPLLWNDIDLAMDAPIKHYLVRSKDAPLRVHIPSREMFAKKRKQIIATCPLLVPHHPRIKQVDLALHSSLIDGGVVQRMVQASLPALTTMTISSDADFSLQLTKGHLPKLRNLSLSGVTLRWSSWTLPDLVSMTLENVTHHRDHDRDRGQLDSLLDALDACSSLESFRYEYVRSVEPKTTPENQTRVVSLSRMRVFTVKAPLANTAAVLAHVALPRDARVYIKMGGLKTVQHPDSSVLATVLSPGPTGLPILTHARHLTLWLNGDLAVWADEHYRFWGMESTSEGCIVASPDLTLRIRSPTLDTEGDMFHSAIREIGGIFSSSIESLILKGPLHLADAETWSRILAAFPHLHHLDLHSPMSGLKGLLMALKPSAGIAPCACLRELYLEHPSQPAERSSDSNGAVTSDLELLYKLRDTLQERGEANSRLEYLYIDLRPQIHSNSATDSASDSEGPGSKSDTLEGARSQLSMLVDELVLDLLD